LAFGMSKLTTFVFLVILSHSMAAKQGTITSENYPNSYPDKFRRIYTINADGKFVIKFTDFVLEDPSSWTFCYDWVMIKDGVGSILLDKTCGSEIPPPITSKTNTAKVIFYTDHSETARGFSLDWEVEEVEEEPSEEPSGEPGFRNDLLAATNDFRRSQGKDDLGQSTRLDRMAQEWADNLAGREDCHIEHSPQRPGYAENISGASPTMSAQGAVKGWKNSPGHRRNMLRDLSKMGAGLAEMKSQCKLRWIAVAVYH